MSRLEPPLTTPRHEQERNFPPNAKLVEDVDIFLLTLSFMYLIIFMFLGSVSRWRNFHQTWCINFSFFNPPFWQCTYWIHRRWLQASFCWLVLWVLQFDRVSTVSLCWDMFFPVTTSAPKNGHRVLMDFPVISKLPPWRGSFCWLFFRLIRGRILFATLQRWQALPLFLMKFLVHKFSGNRWNCKGNNSSFGCLFGEPWFWEEQTMSLLIVCLARSSQ